MSQPDDSRTSAIGAFLEAEDLETALDVIRDSPDDLLADVTLAALDRLIATEPDALRRDRLVERRALLAAVHGVRAQVARLPEEEQRYLAFRHLPNALGVAALVLDESEDVLDGLERAAEAQQATAAGKEAADIATRLADLRRARADGPAVLRARLDAAEAAAIRLGPDLVEWMSTPDWAASEAYLRAHADDLVAAEGEAAMSVLLLANRHVEAISVHAHLLRLGHEQGIDAAYAWLDRELADTRAAVEDLLQDWIDAPDWAASQAYIQAHEAELLSDEGEAAVAALAAARPEIQDLATHTNLLRRCRKIGIPAAYDELRLLVDDPLDAALAALLAVDSPGALVLALNDHPILRELRAVEQVGEMARQARAAGATAAATQVLYYATVMSDGYLRDHAADADPREQAAFVTLIEQLISLAEGVADADLAAELRAMARDARELLDQPPGDPG